MESLLFSNKEIFAALTGGVLALVAPQFSKARSNRGRRQRLLPQFWWLSLIACCLSGLCCTAAKEAIRKGPLSVHLKRQQIPLHSEGGIVQHKSAYYGEIQLAGPQSQPFSVVFDTGSGHLVLPSTMCRSESCLSHRRYKRKASLLAQDIDVDGSVVKPGQMRDQITVSFGTGEVTGVFVRDRVCIGHPSPSPKEAESGASLLQIGSVMPPERAQVNDTEHTASGALIEEPRMSLEDAAAAVSGGDAALAKTVLLALTGKGDIPKKGAALDAARQAAQKAFRKEHGDGCIDLRLIASTDMSSDPFGSFNFDGVMGLGLAGLSQTSQFNFVEMAAEVGAWNAMPGAERTFAVFLAVNDEEQSEITFGGWEESHIKEGEVLAWNPVRDPEMGYWQLNVLGVTANGKKIDFCNEGCRAVVDTGTSLLGVPTDLGQELAQTLRHSAGPDGACDAQMPLLEIHLEHFTVVLEPPDYARPEFGGDSQLQALADAADKLTQSSSSSASVSKESGSNSCIPMLMHIDLPEPIGPKTMILGEPVLQRYYTAFDAGAKRIGFATARRTGTREQRIFA